MYAGTALILYLSQVGGNQFLNIGSDSVLLNYIQGTLEPAARKLVDGYCNHGFGTPSLGTIRLDGSGKDVLFFPPQYYPLIGFSAGSVDSTGLTLSDVKVYPGYVRLHSSNFPYGKQNVVFYGSYGYLSVPEDVAYVTAQLCANILQDMLRRHVAPDLMAKMFNASDQGQGEVSSLFAMPNIFNAALKQMLHPYVAHWVDLG